MGRNCGYKMGKYVRLLDLYGEGLRDRMAGVIASSQRVSCGFCGSYVHAARIRRPNWAGLRLKRDLFGVSHAIAELSRFTTADLLIPVKSLNRELGTAHLFDAVAVLFALFLCRSIAGALINLTVFTPTRKSDPANIDSDNDEKHAGVNKRILPDRLFARWGRRIHKHLLRFGRRIHRAADLPPGN